MVALLFCVHVGIRRGKKRDTLLGTTSLVCSQTNFQDSSHRTEFKSTLIKVLHLEPKIKWTEAKQDSQIGMVYA